MRVVYGAGGNVDGGWALGDWPLTRRLSYVPIGDVREPAYTIGDAWEPPHPLALPADLCDELLTTADRVAAEQSPNGTYYYNCLTPELKADVVERFARANDIWWQLEIDEWFGGLKRYDVGQHHVVHQDLHAGAARRKFAGVVQLSNPADYEGGALTLRFSTERAEMPRTRGTLVAFAGWTNHEVEPVTAGTRWSLCVNGWGPPLR